jgi:hypothetical protein
MSSSSSVFKQETQTEEIPQTSEFEQSWWIPRDSASEKRLILVLTKMAEHLLTADVANGDGKYEQTSFLPAVNAPERKPEGRRKRKGNPNESNDNKRTQDAAVQLKMFD